MQKLIESFFSIWSEGVNVMYDQPEKYAFHFSTFRGHRVGDTWLLERGKIGGGR